jgi:DDE domain
MPITERELTGRTLRRTVDLCFADIWLGGGIRPDLARQLIMHDVARRWTYLYRAIDQFGQVIDVPLSPRRDLAAARRFFTSRCAPVRSMVI